MKHLLLTFVLVGLGASISSCTSDGPFAPKHEERRSDTLAIGKAAGYILTAIPNKPLIRVGDCLTFSGMVLKANGQPAPGVSVNAEDPIKEATAKAAVTDAAGRWSYTVEALCPARYNSKAGNFKFRFSVQGSEISTTSNVTVQIVPPNGLREILAKNTSASTYQIQVTVDGSNKGTIFVKPGQSVTLYRDNQFRAGQLMAFVKDAKGKNLWTTWYNINPTNLPTTSSYLNPYYSSWKLSSVSRVDGRQRSTNYTGATRALYENLANKQVSLGNAQFNVANATYEGINFNGGGSISGPGCSTFLGGKVSCTVDCQALSVGLQVCMGAGAGWSVGPAKIGCTANCCIQVASVSCQLASAEVSISGVYK